MRSGKQHPIVVVGGIFSFLFLDVAVLVQQLCFQGIYVHFVKAFFHGRNQDFAFRVGQPTRQTRVATGGFGVGNGTDISLCVDSIRPDKQLIAFPVNHTVGGRPSGTFGADGKLQAGRDFVKFVRRSKG